ncbi:MAG: DEAD/DEAH box helicase, partial [Candidatus Omnitrophica bacterium]|nr:DEAD/DEAH box helicase [Candidatus Omnitrophota bacterium]
MTHVPIHPFPYDPFQARAIEIIDRDCSLFVAAPTGSGKTVLADYVIERTLERHQRVIYAAPIKALSNQKFRDFTARHGEQVGILTGDVTINPTAPLVIMTTEIYRNTLLEDPERVSAYHWIIFDEIHYLDDPERGTVWEEAILFSPPHIQLLALSATIPNVEELAQWIRAVHQRPVEVIEETKRPVPLTVLFQCQNRIFTDLNDLKREGYRNVEQWPRVRHHQGHPHRWAVHANRIDRLVRELQDRERLPCILFTFGRRRAEELAWEIAGESLVSPEERAVLRTMFETLCAQFHLTHDRSLEPLRHLIDRGVGYHHAGMMPLVKEVVERCFTSRLMKLIVTTETFALGINMPARSVVLDALQKRSDSGFELLRRRDVLQMAGRAGRRGMDEAGFVYLRVNPRHVTYPEVARLLHATPEPVQSRFNTSYATLLNLYRRHGRSLLDLFPRTLYYAQTHGARRAMGLDLMQRKLDLLESMGYITRTALTPKGEFGAWVYGYELLLTELHSAGRLAELDALALAILVAAAVYEPRPRMG